MRSGARERGFRSTIASGARPALVLIGLVGTATGGVLPSWLYAVGPAAGLLLVLVFVAGPFRRSGATGIPGFVGARLDSPPARRATAVLATCVVALFVPALLRASGLVLVTLLGLPYELAVLTTAATVMAATLVRAIPDRRGMRPAVPVAVAGGAAAVWIAFAGPGLRASAAPLTLARVAAAGAFSARSPLSGTTAILSGYSVLLALACGIAVLPTLLSRITSSDDGRHARSTVLAVLTLSAIALGAGVALSAASPGAFAAGGASARLLMLGGLATVVAALYASVASVAAALTRELTAAGAGDASSHRFRAVAVATAALGAAVAAVSQGVDLSQLVDWGFALAASTLFPVLVLGSWFRDLTRAGAFAGLGAGTAVTVLAATASLLASAGILALGPTAAALAGQPTILTLPISLLVMVAVSRATRLHIPAEADRRMLRLHAPEGLGLHLGRAVGRPLGDVETSSPREQPVHRPDPGACSAVPRRDRSAIL